MSKRITMLSTCAKPDAIYHEGKTYVVSDEFAAQLLEAGAGAEISSPAAELAARHIKPVAPQSPPDPGEVDTGEDDETDDSDDEAAE